MPSITWWNRLEPRPRSTDLLPGLTACVRDPAFMLMRQFQFGEFRGEDSGSPAYVSLAARCGPVMAWGVNGEQIGSLPAEVPLEKAIEGESFTPDLSLRVELGHTFEAFLARHNAPKAVLDAFRTHYLIPVSTETDLAALRDQDEARFRRVCGGRALDGGALHEAVRSARPADPVPVASFTEHDQITARNALADFGAWIAETFGAIGLLDSSAWQPERLAYAADVTVALPSGHVAVLAASPGREAEFEWFAFDEHTPSAPSEFEPTVSTSRQIVLPNHVRFRGMPNHRFWDFESGDTDLGGIVAENRDLARMLVMDFMLVHANDWFVVPFEQSVGTLCDIESLVVYDVFGDATLVERADRRPTVPGERWTMFSTAVKGDPSRVAGCFFLPASASKTMEVGPALEEVRFMRDEMANMAWAVEHATENAVGEPWRGHERDLAGRSSDESHSPGPGTNAPGPRRIGYRIQTSVPEHWIPLVPVLIDSSRRAIALAAGALVRAPAGDVLELTLPHGRILRPANASSTYRIREEEISRVGTRITRVVCRSRWTDGSTHLWVARRRSAGAGEGSSGIRFDSATEDAKRS